MDTQQVENQYLCPHQHQWHNQWNNPEERNHFNHLKAQKNKILVQSEQQDQDQDGTQELPSGIQLRTPTHGSGASLEELQLKEMLCDPANYPKDLPIVY